jgi:hypothetical protein
MNCHDRQGQQRADSGRSEGGDRAAGFALFGQLAFGGQSTRFFRGFLVRMAISGFAAMIARSVPQRARRMGGKLRACATKLRQRGTEAAAEGQSSRQLR